MLTSRNDIIINNVSLGFTNFIPPHALTYKTDQGDEAVISYNENTGGIIGTLKTVDGHSFALEACGGHFIFEEFDLTSFEEEELSDEAEEDFVIDIPPRRPETRVKSGPNEGQRTYSVMFYYTPEFAAATPNIEDFIDQVIAETNQGYVNSEIPVTVTKFCHEEATVHDTNSSSDLLDNFMNMKGSYEELRNTADTAALLALEFSGCGRATTFSYAYGNTVSVTKKSCALGYYSFGHEIGHHFGCLHNIEQKKNVEPQFCLWKMINPFIKETRRMEGIVSQSTDSNWMFGLGISKAGSLGIH